MTDMRQAAQQALEALEQCGLDDTHRSYEFEHAARAALRDALAQQEPLAGMSEMNRTIAYCAAAKLREFGYEWDGKAWTALAQQEQEPVAWRDPATDDIVSVARRAAWETDYGLGGKDRAATYTEPLYTHPPRREWQSLSDAEVQAIHQSLCNTVGSDYRTVARAIEQALKEKNA